MKKLVVFLLAALALPAILSAHGVVIIRMTDDGFEPREITVDENTVVRFINEDRQDRWPASNLHPTHTDYSEFDPLRPIPPEDSWGFRFEKLGSWKYHDHLEPTTGGVINVVDDHGEIVAKESENQKQSFGIILTKIWETISSPFSRIFSRLTAILSKDGGVSREFKEIDENGVAYIRSQMRSCYETGGVSSCYREVADNLTSQFQVVDIMNAFQDNEQYQEIFTRCHQVTHYLGQTLYREDKSVLQSYGKCTPACWGGCYHGVIEGYFGAKNLTPGTADDETILEEIVLVCEEEKGKASTRLYSECLHGIGHAMMFITNSDLPRSLVFCNALANVVERETCYGGVFMENSSSSTSLDHPSAYIKEEDVMYPCNVLDERYLNLCYQYQSSHFSIITNWNWQEVVSLCLQVPRKYQNGCFEIMGSNQIGYTQDFSKMLSNCDLAGVPRLQRSCINGAASGLGGRYVGDATYLTEFCALVDKDYKEVCYTAMGNALASWGSKEAEINEMCANIQDDQYISLCENI